MQSAEKTKPGDGAAAALLAALTQKRRLDAATPKESALWLLDRLLPDAGVNNVPFAVRVAGRLDTAALQSAVDTVVRRHEVLRTVYLDRQAGLVREVLGESTRGPRVELHESDADVPEKALREFAATPIRCDGRLMLRAAVFRGPGTDTLAVVVHHLVFDAASVPVLIGELAAAYDAHAAGGDLPDVLRGTVPALRAAEPRAESLAHWRGALDGFDPAGLDLDCTRPAPARPTLAGDTVLHVLDDDTRALLRGLQRTLRAPEAVVLLTAFCVLLAAHGAGPDLVVGSPVNVRPPEGQSAIGYHVNTLPLRLAVDPRRGFRELVKEARTTFFGALAHSDVPVDAIAHETARETVSWRDTLFQHMFNYVPVEPAPPLTLGGLHAQPVHVETGYSKFDVELFVQSGPDQLGLRLLYCAELLDRADAEALTRRYAALLHTVAAEPDRPVGELDVWSDADRALPGPGTARSVAAPAREADRDLDTFRATPAGPALGLAEAAARRAADGIYPYVVHPLDARNVAVVDRSGRRLPAGVRGEVCLVRPDGATHVATGWTGSLRRDGALELYGQAERVARRHGRAVHPERVEAVLLAHPEVTGAVFVAADEAALAFVTLDERPGLTDEVAAHAARLLPRAVQPDRVVRTDALPRRPDGGWDTAALLGLAAAEARTEQADPDGLVGDLRGLWRDLLGLAEPADADANFFALGGHSLLGAQLVQRVDDVTGTRIRLADLFDNPTPRGLARYLRELRDDS
ncbi:MULTISPECIES: condensation domain-containing protein [unclassified Streptomyces]|uniref:condensation domain-containing protein n=1 Tax=unclassified Streptomyces TaxID=2593676 RepID=UPI00380BEC96